MKISHAGAGSSDTQAGSDDDINSNDTGVTQMSTAADFCGDTPQGVDVDLIFDMVYENGNWLIYDIRSK